MKPNAPFSAVVVAGGSGSRSGGPKQWRSLAGKPVVRWSVEALVAAGAEQVIVVIPAGAEPEANQALAGLDRVKLAIGGKERKDSVLAGLQALSCAAEQVVLVHDAARPFLTTEHIERILAATAAADGALLALAVTDTLKRAEPDGVVLATQTRQGLYRAQTPQAFARGRLQSALENWAGDTPPTDDAEAVERLGGRVIIVPGDPQLMKLTYPEDFALAESWISERRETRVGQGFDVHAWGPGEAAWLCGVKIDHDQSLIGHSDADAGLHAVTDALLGALGDGDIGDHFPPTDPQWRGAPSKVFAAFAAERVRSAGGRILNVDVTLICERPKIKPHRQAMRAALADILAIDIARISVKATTTEKLGFTGRGEGLAAQAVAAIEIPGGRP